MFQRARELLEDYYSCLLEKGASQLAEFLLQEVRARLRELQYIYDRLLVLEQALVSEAKAESPQQAAQAEIFKLLITQAERPDCKTRRHAYVAFSQADEVRVLLEAFYYSAHRIRDILRDFPNELPGLRSFEARGVRDVRNHLVEHPTRKSGVPVVSIAVGGPVGPQLRPLRPSEGSPGTFDEGLHANARQFAEALGRTISKVLNARMA